MPPEEPAAASAVATYAFVARPFGGEVRLSLCDGALAVDDTKRVKRIELKHVSSVRLTYEPRNALSRGFRCRIGTDGGDRVSLTNVSWKSMIETINQAEAYRAFLAALLPAIAAANPQCRFIAGKSRWAWRLHVIVSVATLATLLWAIWSYAGRIGGAGIAMLAAFVAWFMWTAAWMIWRNRPGRFDPAAPPPDLTP